MALASKTRMTKLTTGVLVGFGAALAGWWYYNKMGMAMPQPDRGEVIFSNSPMVS